MSRRISTAITIAALLVAGGHQIFPSIVFDTATLALFGIAVVPWLAKLLKSVELPGGVKIEFQDFKKAEVQADEVGLLASLSTKDQQANAFVVQQDPNLALSGLQIEIEIDKRLRAIAERNGISNEGASIRFVLHQLREKDILTPKFAPTGSDLYSRILHHQV